MSDDDITTVSAPIPVGARRIPGGSRLILDVFAQAVIEDAVGALLSTDPKDDLYERLVELAELTPDERRLQSEQRLPFEELVTDLAARASKHTHLYGERGLVLAELLAANAVAALPSGHWAAEALRAWQSVEADAAAEALNGGAAA